MRSQLASAVVLGLLIAGCGGDGENFVGGGFNGGGGGDAPVKPSISLGSTTLFRPTRQLFPNLGVTGPLLGDSVVTIVLTGDGTLKKPLDGPKNTSTLSADGKTLTVNFTNATAEEITSYLKANLTPDTITGPRKEAKVKVTLANAGASAEGSADLLTANKGALVLKVEPGAAGVVTNVDTGADTTKRGLQQALDLVAAVSSGSEGAGSVIGLATGEFPIADSAFSTGLGIRVHPDADLAFLTIAGPNVGNPGDPNVPTGSSARVAGAVLRGATGNGGGFSQAMLSVQASDVLLRGLDLVVPGSNSLRAG
ncbi:MAG: hypothetical protein KIS61_24380, partial [Candidatus Eremiobacteraeota bacterium]|nr:hypothetical protein [Candidatus Eremiobacteraeota bacterium]